MFDKYFKNKKFVFIFSFVLTAVFYTLFNILEITGKFHVPDMALSPMLGLMFGPIGGLGQFFATFILEVYLEHDPFISFLECLQLFFISVLSYKLWYSIFKAQKLRAPRFNSNYNILKFIVIIAIASAVYEIWINILFHLLYDIMSDLYTPYNFINRFIYGLNFFNYSTIFGLLFISIFNYFKIPFQIPSKNKVLPKINSNYFRLFFIVIAAYILLHLVFKFNTYLDVAVLIISTIILVIYLITSIDEELDSDFEEYSIIEKIIFVFIAIVSISMFLLFDDFIEIFMKLSIFGFNGRAIYLIAIFVNILILLFLVMVHTHFVEKLLTNPIKELSEAVNNYASDKMKIHQEHFSLKFNRYLKNNDDISVLIKSFMQLSSNIKRNLDKIKTTVSEKERFETEFNVASKIQKNMLPTNFEEFSEGKGFEIYAYMNPAREVGGDFYDYFSIDDENISFAIGDVSGKGIPATLFMVKTMHLIKNHSFFNENLSDVFYEVNNLSCQRNDEELFVTSWLGKLNFKSGKLFYVNAGHNQPLIRQNNGDFEYWDVRPNLVLGGMEDIPYKEHSLDLKPGDMIFLYTDGVTEANDDYRGFYGEDRLKEILNKYKDESLIEIITKVKDDVGSFCNNHDQFDDVTMIILKYEGWEDEKEIQ